MKPNIYMFHRICFDELQSINPYYAQRGMVLSIHQLTILIKGLLMRGLVFGSIPQTLKSKNHFHLSFDDGFKEHLYVAKLLIEKFNAPKYGVSFSINVGNSILGQHTGMDLFYTILKYDKMAKLGTFLQKDLQNNSIDEIKECVASLKPKELVTLSNHFAELHSYLKPIFLNEEEIKELSDLFTISSHGITHRFLTCHEEQSKEEIIRSKKILEDLCGSNIETFCYPEGKNTAFLREQCKQAGYSNALSIRHKEHNLFCIGRQ
ncbi:polysaccharide deacetylase family protein [Saccharicrinis sp. FJH2]|uniref:polysaccharide deacetylase family protein n=1 Tax=Saccharicrinis sp. FJH65 TaxID=3344659 RepID=UPI0035F47F9E